MQDLINSFLSNTERKVNNIEAINANIFDLNYKTEYFDYILYRMNLFNIIQRSTDFGTLRSRDNFFSFALKCLFYIIPAIILGNYTDIYIEKLKQDKALGDNEIYYILLQTLINISTFYLILIFFSDFTSEFQVTIACSYFSVIYFGLQPNYINMIKDYIN